MRFWKSAVARDSGPESTLRLLGAGVAATANRTLWQAVTRHSSRLNLFQLEQCGCRCVPRLVVCRGSGGCRCGRGVVWIAVSQGSLSAHVFATHVRTAMEGFRALLEGPCDVECV